MSINMSTLNVMVQKIGQSKIPSRTVYPVPLSCIVKTNFIIRLKNTSAS